MTMLGGVPISVTMPPRMLAKDMGMRVRAAVRFAFLAASMSTGISSASAATLFISVDSEADSEAITAMWAPRRRDLSTR